MQIDCEHSLTKMHSAKFFAILFARHGISPRMRGDLHFTKRTYTAFYRGIRAGKL